MMLFTKLWCVACDVCVCLKAARIDLNFLIWDLLYDVQTILKNYILEEFNVLGLTLSREENKWATMSVTPNSKVLGKRLGKDFKKVKMAIPKLGSEEIATYLSTGSLDVEGQTLSGDDLIINREFKGDKETYEADTAPDNSLLVIVDTRQDDELKAQGTARELVNRIQQLRKSSGCQVRVRELI